MTAHENWMKVRGWHWLTLWPEECPWSEIKQKAHIWSLTRHPMIRQSPGAIFIWWVAFPFFLTCPWKHSPSWHGSVLETSPKVLESKQTNKQTINKQCYWWRTWIIDTPDRLCSVLPLTWSSQRTGHWFAGLTGLSLEAWMAESPLQTRYKKMRRTLPEYSKQQISESTCACVFSLLIYLFNKSLRRVSALLCRAGFSIWKGSFS